MPMYTKRPEKAFTAFRPEALPRGDLPCDPPFQARKAFTPVTRCTDTVSGMNFFFLFFFVNIVFLLRSTQKEAFISGFYFRIPIMHMTAGADAIFPMASRKVLYLPFAA